ncbi:hypothetical protein LTR53_002590 [Teratosphaeriaceae sp. CCFEE 6253]|nr:hypothetical protein LTR53_002590 [Teratosphaeriaceae sp. CCFEE 6253]
MCILTSKLCYCMHRSPPRWLFCVDSIQATPHAALSLSPELAQQPCETEAANLDLSTSVHHSEQRNTRERCAGNVDFCCSGECCRKGVAAEQRKRDRLLKGASSASAGLSELAGIGQVSAVEAADDTLDRERRFHEQCGPKRAEYFALLREEQPCLFDRPRGTCLRGQQSAQDPTSFRTSSPAYPFDASRSDQPRAFNPLAPASSPATRSVQAPVHRYSARLSGTTSLATMESAIDPRLRALRAADEMPPDTPILSRTHPASARRCTSPPLPSPSTIANPNLPTLQCWHCRDNNEFFIATGDLDLSFSIGLPPGCSHQVPRAWDDGDQHSVSGGAMDLCVPAGPTEGWISCAAAEWQELVAERERIVEGGDNVGVGAMGTLCEAIERAGRERRRAPGRGRGRAVHR